MHKVMQFIYTAAMLESKFPGLLSSVGFVAALIIMELMHRNEKGV